nr:tetratricopeptide repeat protein [Kofleriaceae bacterium]
MTRARRLELAAIALAIVVYAVSLGRAVRYEYVWDDVAEIEASDAFDKPLADGLRLTQTARQDPGLVKLRGAQLIYDSYRPLLFASYWCEVRAFGRTPAPMHATNLALGALAVVLAWRLARRWLGPGVAAGGVAAVFALHPQQIEAVAYISGRGDLLGGVLALAAALAALRGAACAQRTGRLAWAAAACVAFAGALLCKEASIGLPLAIAGSLWAARAPRRAWWTIAAMAGVIAGYLALRAAVVGPVAGSALGGALAIVPGVVAAYARVFALPFDLSTERLYDGAATYAGWAAVVVAGALAAVAARHRVRALAIIADRDLRAAIAGLAWAAALLAPAAMPIASAHVVADRYGYAALLGFATAAAAGVRRVVRGRPRARVAVTIAAGVWGALLVAVGWQQVPVWRDNLALYRHAVAMTPDSSEAHYRLGFLAAASGDCDDALPELEQATALDPANVRALDDLGVCLMRVGRDADAEPVLARSVAASPAAFRSWFNLGVVRLRLGDHRGGCDALARSLAIAPDYALAAHEQARACR